MHLKKGFVVFIDVPGQTIGLLLLLLGDENESEVVHDHDRDHRGGRLAPGGWAETRRTEHCPEAPTPEMLKRMKADSEMSSSVIQPPQSNGASSSKGKSRAAKVEDYDEENEGNTSADFAPGNDADYYAEEDGEGRFFGGGLTDEQKTILNIFDKAPGRHEDAQEDVSRTFRDPVFSFDLAETRCCV